MLAYACLAASGTLLQQLLACLKLNLDSEDLFCWCKQKPSFLWTMAAAQAAENHRDEWDLTWYLRWGIYKSIWTRTYSQNSKIVISYANVRRNKYKTAELWESQTEIRVGKLTIWVSSFEIEKLNRVHQVYQFHQVSQSL